MAATLSAESPIIQDGRHIYEVTLATVNDFVVFMPTRDANFSEYPVIAHINRGSGDTLRALYSLDPDLSTASYILMSYGDITTDLSPVFDFYACGYQINKTTGGGTTTVRVVSTIPLAWKTA